MFRTFQWIAVVKARFLKIPRLNLLIWKAFGKCRDAWSNDDLAIEAIALPPSYIN